MFVVCVVVCVVVYAVVAVVVTVVCCSVAFSGNKCLPHLKKKSHVVGVVLFFSNGAFGWICFPGTLASCSTLREVHLQSNRLRDLGEIPEMKRLERLYLHNNRISSVDEVRHL